MAKSDRPRTRIATKTTLRRAEYAGRLRLVRQFTTGFDAANGYDLRRIENLSSSQKREINRYFDVLSQLTFRPHYVYHPRSAKNLRAAKRTNGTEKFNKINVGIFQVPTRLDVSGRRVAVKPRVHVSRHGDVSLEFPHGIKRGTLLFEAYAIAALQEDMAQDYFDDTGDWYDPTEFEPDDTDVQYYIEENLAELTQQMVDDSDMTYFTVIAGQFEIGRGVPRFFYKDKVVDEVKRLQDIYNQDNRDDCDPDDPSSHHWRNWLFGINAYKFSNFQEQKSYVKAVREHTQFREGVNKEMKAARKRAEYWEKKLQEARRDKKLTNKQLEKRERQIASNIDHYNRIVNALIIKRARGKLE